MLRRRLDGGLPATVLMDSENQPQAEQIPEVVLFQVCRQRSKTLKIRIIYTYILYMCAVYNYIALSPLESGHSLKNSKRSMKPKTSLQCLEQPATSPHLKAG
jgi:hypothetical protein